MDAKLKEVKKTFRKNIEEKKKKKIPLEFAYDNKNNNAFYLYGVFRELRDTWQGGWNK